MTLSPYWSTWAKQVPILQTQIDVGLHLDWTSHFAQQQGFGESLGRVMARSLVRALPPAKVIEQINRQLDLFEQHAGTRPDHIDGHQHVQQFPVIREALIDTLIKRYPSTSRPWLRVSKVVDQPWDLKARVINAMGADALLSLAKSHGIAHSQFLTGIYDFSGNIDDYRQRLHTWLTHLPPGSVMMCHPGTDIDPTVPFAQARPREQRVLSDSTLQSLLDEQHIRVVRGTTLFAPSLT